jgi:hypothetical protein
MGTVTTRPSGCRMRTWLPLCRVLEKPALSSARTSSVDSTARSRFT